jgi:hypothetical protein
MRSDRREIEGPREQEGAARARLPDSPSSWYSSRGWPVPRVSSPGVPGLIRGMREWLSSFASYEVEIERAVEVGASVVLLTIERGRSLRGGVPVEQKGAVVWTFDGEAVVRIETYLDRRLALKALSLPG